MRRFFSSIPAQQLKLSITGDTAKILVLTLERVCTFTLRLNYPNILYTLSVFGKGENWDKIFGKGDSSIPARLDAPIILLPPTDWQQDEPPQPTPSWQSPYYLKATLEAN